MNCSRCGALLAPGDKVLEVRLLTRIYTDDSVATDRSDPRELVHASCPARWRYVFVTRYPSFHRDRSATL